MTGYVETVTDPFYGPDDEMLEYGRILRDHMPDWDFSDNVIDEFDDYYFRAFAGMTLEEFDGFVKRMVLREADGFEGMTYAEGDTLIRTDQAMVYNYHNKKVAQIAQETGRQPVLSFGNSSGDVSMHNYTICNNPYKSLAFMLIADDDVRDYGDAGEELRERWEESGYPVISMKKDWQTIYGEDVMKTGSFHWLEDLAEQSEHRS